MAAAEKACGVLQTAYHQSRGCLPYTGGHAGLVLYIGVGALLVGVLIALLSLKKYA